MHGKLPLIVWVALLLHPSTVGWAQTAQPGSAPPVTFRSQSILIQVPVVASDKSGNHVHKLTASDFKILQNGKEQKITGFEEINAEPPTSQPPIASSDTFSNTFGEAAQPPGLTVILIDQINTPFLDQASGRYELIRALAKGLQTRGPVALMLLNSQGLRTLAPATTNFNSLVEALKRVGGELPATSQINAAALFATQLFGWDTRPGDVEQRLRYFSGLSEAMDAGFRQQHALEATMQGFLAIAWTLSGVPGRKSVLWASGGFPFYLSAPGFVPGIPHVDQLYERAMEALNDAQVSVYPWDVRGVLGPSDWKAGDGDMGQYASGDPFWGYPSGANPGWSRRQLAESVADSFHNIAEMTGGRAFVNTNSVEKAFASAVSDSSSFYLLSYQLDRTTVKESWQKLQVKTQTKDVQVRSRTGFFAGRAMLDPDSLRRADIEFALSCPVDSTGIPLSVHLIKPLPTSKEKETEFRITVPASVVDESRGNHFDIAVAWQVSQNGKGTAPQGRSITNGLTAEGLKKVKAEGLVYANKLSLVPGEYEIRFVVRDNLSGKVGSVSAQVKIS
jgi:VWFA-related protein